MSVKNWTKWDKVLNTWVAYTNIKTDTDDSMSMYIAWHMTCDSMGGYNRHCGCDTYNDNTVCIRNSTTREDACSDLGTPDSTYVKGSDVSAFFTVNVVFNVPEFDIHDLQAGTGDWVGPLAIFLPDDGDAATGANSTRTELRYAYGLYADEMETPDGYNLSDDDGFDALFGVGAIKATVPIQKGGVLNGDPMAAQLGTCKNGDAKPVLPLVDYQLFNDENGEEQLDIRFIYNLFTFPKASSPMRKAFPILKARGWPVNGPYCYEGELIGWTLDFSFDTRVGSKYVNFFSGCVEGIPCTPDWFSPCDTCSNAFIETDQKEATVQLQLTLYLVIATACLAVISCCLCGSTFCYRRKLLGKEDELRKEREELESFQNRGASSGIGGGSEYTKLLGDGAVKDGTPRQEGGKKTIW